MGGRGGMLGCTSWSLQSFCPCLCRTPVDLPPLCFPLRFTLPAELHAAVLAALLTDVCGRFCAACFVFPPRCWVVLSQNSLISWPGALLPLGVTSSLLASLWPASPQCCPALHGAEMQLCLCCRRLLARLDLQSPSASQRVFCC